jgi:hypothetical protein
VTSLEVIPEPVAPRDLLVRPAAVDAVVANQRAYQALCHALLDDSDYQTYDGGRFKKKSAWRKLNVAFNVDTEIRHVEEVRDDDGRLVRAAVTARATAPNGRICDGIGVCDQHDRHQRNCIRTGSNACDGFRHFAHPEHDILATAHTRATNRAAADLYGMGEVSAEEVDARAEPRFDAGVVLEPFMSADVRPGLAEWRRRMRYPGPSAFTPRQVAEALVEVGRILERLANPPCDTDEPTPPAVHDDAPESRGDAPDAG